MNPGFIFSVAILVSSHLSANVGQLQTPVRPPAHLLSDEQNTIKIFQSVAGSVVNVSNMRYARTGYFSADVQEVPAGSGSGFVWDQDGHIVTNFHVVKGADSVAISFKDGTSLKAKIVGVEPRKDIAVLRVLGAANLSFSKVNLANSANLLVGQKAIAIGSPFGLDQTLTTGIISALGRAIPGIGRVTIRDMIQTDASINPGNSGGPLLDSRGYLIGMNTMIFTQSGTSAGVGFAVPSNTIARIVKQIVQFGKVKQPGIGISAFPDDVAQRVNIKGVVIRAIISGSGAAKAGLRGTQRRGNGQIILGDVIVEIGGHKIVTYDDLYNALEGRKIGTEVSVTIVRGNTKLNVQIPLMDLSSD